MSVAPTPLVHSSYLSRYGRDVWLKLENLHPSHSFKYRGQCAFVENALRTRGPNVHVMIASGGNAGLACACAANVLKVRCTVYLPVAATQETINLLKKQNAGVVVAGQSYSGALEALRKDIANDPNAVDAPAYDHPILWESQGRMIKEIYTDLKQVKPAAIICSVGGGSMFGGVMDGCNSVGWNDVPLITVETIGSNCFYHTMQLNRRKNHALPAEFSLHEHEGIQLAHQNTFHSVASGSLGASRPAPGVVKMALGWKAKITCVTIPDALALQTLLRFSNEHKMLVEPSCATSLSMVHRPDLLGKLVQKDGPVVVIVCGGFKISMADLPDYEKMIGSDRISTSSVFVDGEETLLARL